MAAQINVESGGQRFGPGQLDRLLALGARGRDLNPPLLAAGNQGALEGKTDKIGQAQRASRRATRASSHHESRRRGRVEKLLVRLRPSSRRRD